MADKYDKVNIFVWFVPVIQQVATQLWTRLLENIVRYVQEVLSFF